MLAIFIARTGGITVIRCVIIGDDSDDRTVWCVITNDDSSPPFDDTPNAFDATPNSNKWRKTAIFLMKKSVCHHCHHALGDFENISFFRYISLYQ